jgi:hypothetical protein
MLHVQVLTPVRRSARKQIPLVQDVEPLLEATNFCYQPYSTVSEEAGVGKFLGNEHSASKHACCAQLERSGEAVARPDA